ncbi:MAG TPA: FlgD immunoglobulin-like domain containing protein [bacterium]|jgi:hypothetical protein|nr:FlgD immunoglobulin-like domain containing protein [bacterium]
MTNLVDQFFQRNLTEAEAQSLEELLGKSPEEALRLGEKMRQEYLAMGLPLPTLAKHFGPPFSGTGLPLLKAALLAVVLAGAGTLAWWFWSRPALQATVPLASVEKPVIPEIPPREVLPRSAAKLPPPPLEIPQRLDASTAEGNRLSVVVELESPAPVEVRILDPKDQPVRTLYQGNLEAGKWAIHWDGLLSNGTKASGGDYRIQVKSGSTEMSKNVSIEAEK